MTIEKLTDEERERLAHMYQTPLGRKALHSIDQLTVALEAHEAAQPFLREQLVSINARSEALQAEVTRLTAALEDMAKTASAGCARCLEREGDAHARAEVTRLTAELEDAGRRILLQADAPELVRSHEALQARVAELEAACRMTRWRIEYLERTGYLGNARWVQSRELCEEYTDRDAAERALSRLVDSGRAGSIKYRIIAITHVRTEARAEALQAEVARLTAALEAAKAGYDAWMRAAEDLGGKLAVAESELEELRGRVKRAEEWLTSAWISNAKRISLAWEAIRDPR